MLYRIFIEWRILPSLPITQPLYLDAQQQYLPGRRYFLHLQLSLKPWPVTPSIPHGLPKMPDILTGVRRRICRDQGRPLPTHSFQKTTTSQEETSCSTRPEGVSQKGTCFRGYHRHSVRTYPMRPSRDSSLATLVAMATRGPHHWTTLDPPPRLLHRRRSTKDTVRQPQGWETSEPYLPPPPLTCSGP